MANKPITMLQIRKVIQLLDQGHSQRSIARQVVLVTTSDRLQIPPIAHFCQLVRQIKQSMIKNLENHHVQP